MKVASENDGPASLPVRLDATPSGHSTYFTYMSLAKALSNKKVQLSFRKFLESEFSVENLDFWLAVQDYDAVKDATVRRSKAKEIYSEYIAPNSPRQVNLDYKTQQHVLAQISDDSLQSTCVFGAAQKSVFKMMENDSYVRFTRSKFYESSSQSGRRSPRMILRDIIHNGSRSRSRSGSH